MLHVCDSLCCWPTGAEQVAEHLQQSLGIGLGETTTDGTFTLLPTCSLGACGDAPALMVGLTTYGHLTPEKIDQVLADVRAEGQG